MQTERIAIIGAMDSEIASLLEAMEERREEAHWGLTFYLGRLEGRNIVLVKCGIGKVNAARCTQILLDLYAPSALLHTGIAGGIGPGLKVGDAVIAQGLIQHDLYATAANGKSPPFLRRMLRSWMPWKTLPARHWERSGSTGGWWSPAISSFLARWARENCTRHFTDWLPKWRAAPLPKRPRWEAFLLECCEPFRIWQTALRPTSPMILNGRQPISPPPLSGPR